MLSGWYNVSFFQTNLLQIESDDQVWYYTNSSIHTYSFKSPSRLSVLRDNVSGMASSSSKRLHGISTLGQQEVDLLASSHTNQCQHYYTWGNLLHLGALGLKNFNHIWQFQVSYIIPPSALLSLVLSMFLAQQVTGQHKDFLFSLHLVG